MLITSIILSILAIICCIIELIYMVIQERRIIKTRRAMKLHLNAVYGKLAYKDVTELPPEELRYLRCDRKTTKKAYKAIKKAYENGCSYVDTDSVYPRRNQND